MPAKVERVVDGDTVRVEARIWIDQALFVAVRIAGVDSPELFRPKCKSEKAHAARAKLFVEEFFSANTATLHDIRHGKYAGRVVARLENEKGEDLGRALVAAGYAAKGDRGKWCGVRSVGAISSREDIISDRTLSRRR